MILVSLALAFHAAGNSFGARPNVLLIVSEDNGPELGCYGDRYARPRNLDRLTAGGVRFNRAFITQAGCSQSRSSIHTGLYPHQNGQIGLATWGFRMYREDTPNLARQLKKAGYHTGIIGKLHINPESAFPFDMKEIPSGNFACKNLADYAKYAETFFKAQDTPFFLSVNYPEAHNPWIRQVDGLPKQPLEAGDVKSLAYFGLDTPKLRELNANYYNCLSRPAAWREQTRDPLLNPEKLKRLKAEVESVSNKPGRKYEWDYPNYFFSSERPAAAQPGSSRPTRTRENAP